MTPTRRTQRPAASTVPLRSEAEPSVFIGIDPGVHGALAVVYPEKRFALPPRIVPTPTMRSGKTSPVLDRRGMAELMAEFPNAFVAIERVNAAPMHGRRQGTGSMFAFGQGSGIWLGILEAMGLPYVEVYPQTWKARLLKGMGTGKGASIRYVRLVAADVNLRPTPRSRVDSDGFADALCLAIFARNEWAIMRTLAASGTFQ